MIGEVKKLLLIPHIEVHNANALSSPFTIGFPAMTAWLGAVHAMERGLNKKGFVVRLSATGVVSHRCNLQTYKGDNDFVHSIIGTGNPLDKTGERSPFIEEARCHLDITLVIEVNHLDRDDHDSFLSTLNHLLPANIKIAGGDIQKFAKPKVETIADEQDWLKLQRKLMPGYALMERRDLMIQAMENGADALDALIDFAAIYHNCEKDEAGNITWHRHRKTFDDKPAGWIIPIATGFHGISEPGRALNQRDPDTPHRFAESVVTLGEFKMPYKINSAEDLLWRYQVEGDLYLCQQRSQQKTPTTTPPSPYDSDD